MPTTEQLEGAAARRRIVLDKIRDKIAEDGYPPSVGELADATGVSKLTTRRDLRALALSGAIEVDAGVARGIRLRP